MKVATHTPLPDGAHKAPTKRSENGATLRPLEPDLPASLALLLARCVGPLLLLVGSRAGDFNL